MPGVCERGGSVLAGEWPRAGGASIDFATLVESWKHRIDLLCDDDQGAEQLETIAQLGSRTRAMVNGRVGRLVEAIGFAYFAPHIDIDRLRHWLEG